MKEKRGFSVAFGPFIGWLIAIIVLVLMVVLVIVLFGRGQGAVDFVKNFFRFGAKV